MKKLLILDFTCPKQYSAVSLEREPLGGTEATVIRIATELGKTNEVHVAQHIRTVVEVAGNVQYTTTNAIETHSRFDAVIHLRAALTIPYFKQKYPDAKHVVWMHDIVGSQFVQHLEVIKNYSVKVIGVSRWHKTQMQDMALRGLEDTKDLRVDYIYNPVVVRKIGLTVDPHKLVFFSSPHKGLVETLENFAQLRREHPMYRLYVANPGYDQRSVPLPENVFNLGSLTHDEVLKHVEESFAVYYPNFIIPETFGLVLAEANAVGTPVVAHPFGAANEILSKEQLIDGRVEHIFNQRLIKWAQQGRPVVGGDKRFELSAIVAQWKDELQLD